MGEIVVAEYTWQKTWWNFLKSRLPSFSCCEPNMHSNNIHIQNQQTLHHTQWLPCPVQWCTCHFAAARTLTLHIFWGNHSFDTNHKQTPPSPMTINAHAELRNSSSSLPVHPYNPLFEELEDYNTSQPHLSPNIASILGSMFEEHATLFEDSSSDRPPHDDAGVPIHCNYHPHLNGMLLSLLL